jgi:hypothetical protein
MRPRLRLHTLILLALTFTLALACATVALADEPEWVASGRVLDAETGQPATGVRHVVYSWDPEYKMLFSEREDYVTSTGRFDAHIPANRPWVIVAFGGKGRYYDQFAGGLRTDFMDVYGKGQFCPSTIPLIGDQAKAQRLNRGKSASFGDTLLETMPQPYGMLAGRISDKASGVGLGGFYVYTWRYDAQLGGWRCAGTYGDTFYDGSFAWRGESPGALLGGVRLQYVVSTPQGKISCFYPNVATVEDALTLDLKPGDVVGGLNVQIDVPNRLLGTIVQTESKEPLDNAIVRLHLFDATSGKWDDQGFADTNSSGSYCIPGIWGLTPGDYRIGVSDRSHVHDDLFYGQASSIGSATTVHLEDGHIIEGLDIWMSNVAAVAGTALGADGVGRPDARVTA